MENRNNLPLILDPRTVDVVKKLIDEEIKKYTSNSINNIISTLALQELRSALNKIVFHNYQIRHNVYELRRKQRG